MSIIWSECGGTSNVRRLASRPWRAVEAQHLVSTRKLVDSDAEQEVLEALLDGAAPSPAVAPDLAGLHALLAAPFRQPPLRHGSRFGTRRERGIWYGSESVATALAEVAYYRLVFLAGSRARLAPFDVEIVTFQAAVATAKGVDLTAGPFARFAGRIASRTSYRDTQALGRALRADGVEAFRFRSARDPEGGANLAVLAPAAFQKRRPGRAAAWFCTVTEGGVRFRVLDPLRARSLEFPRAVFEVKGRLPAPAV